MCAWLVQSGHLREMYEFTMIFVTETFQERLLLCSTVSGMLMISFRAQSGLGEAFVSVRFRAIWNSGVQCAGRVQPYTWRRGKESGRGSNYGIVRQYYERKNSGPVLVIL